MSEHYQQLPTPAAWMTLESNNRPNHSSTMSEPTTPQQHTPETARRLLYQPMKNSRSSISEGTSPPKHSESKPGSVMHVTSQFDSHDANPTPPSKPTPPAKQDHYQDFSHIVRDSPTSPSPNSSSFISPSNTPPVPPREYQSLPNIPRNRTATTFTTHTSPNHFVHAPPAKATHNSEKHYQAINPAINPQGQSNVTIPPPSATETNNNKSHYMAVPDFSKLKSESFAGPRRMHAATVAEGRKIEPVASDSVLYTTSRSKPTDSVDSNFVPYARDEYQKIPSKEEMQSMILQKRNNSSQTNSPPNQLTKSSSFQSEPANDNPPPESQTEETKSNEATAAPLPIALEGFLGKKGDVGVIKAWKRRWFVLRLDLLVYYKEDRDQDIVIGFIPLCDASAVYPSANTPTNTAFQIDTKERVWYLRADTKTEMDQWIEACKKNCSIKELPTPVDDIQKRQSMVAIARNQTLTKEGELEKLHGNHFRMRKVLVKSGILYKYLSKTDTQPSKMTLFKCSIDDEVPEHGPLAFRLQYGTKTFTFRASSDKEKGEWLELLMKHKLLTETIINHQ